MPPPAEEKKDSGLGLEWVYLNADVGGSYVDMASINASHLALQKTAAAGPTFGAAAGIRLFFFSLGVRARDMDLSSLGNLWLLDAEAAFHIRIWHIDPYFGVRGGYSFVGSLNSASFQGATGGSNSSVTVHGFKLGPMVGLDYYFIKYISVGVDADLQFLFLQRPAAKLPPGVNASQLPPTEQILYQESGSSAGYAVTIAPHLGIHF